VAKEFSVQDVQTGSEAQLLHNPICTGEGGPLARWA